LRDFAPWPENSPRPRAKAKAKAKAQTTVQNPFGQRKRPDTLVPGPLIRICNTVRLFSSVLRRCLNFGLCLRLNFGLCLRFNLCLWHTLNRSLCSLLALRLFTRLARRPGFARLRCRIVPRISSLRIRRAFRCLHKSRLRLVTAWIDQIRLRLGSGDSVLCILLFRTVLAVLAPAMLSTILTALVLSILSVARLLLGTLCFALAVPFGTFAIPLCTFTIPLGLTLAVLLLLLLALGINFFLRSPKHAQIMLGMLEKILCRNTVARQLCIPPKLLVFIDNLLRRAAHLTLWPRAVKNPVRDIAAALRTVAIVFPRTGFG
jgi:hypothetical protein